MVGASFFVDTNVLLYSLDLRSPVKQARAAEWISFLWSTGAGRLSWQVLHEFYANAVRKARVPSRSARDAVAVFSRWHPEEMTIGLIERGWYWMDHAQLSYWDSLIMASAERMGCSFLLSEDFEANRSYEGVTVINPFERSSFEFAPVHH